MTSQNIAAAQKLARTYAPQIAAARNLLDRADVQKSITAAGLPKIDMANMADIAAGLPKIDFDPIIAANMPDMFGPAATAGLAKMFDPISSIDISGFSKIDFDPIIAGLPKIDMANMADIAAGLPKIEFPAFAQVSAVASSLTRFSPNFIFSIPELMKPFHQALGEMQTAIFHQAFGEMQNTISSFLESWGTLADFGHRVARTGLMAAFRARDAAVKGDNDALAAFIHKWLGIKKVTKNVLQAAAAALLDPAWLEEGAHEIITDLKRLYRRHKRGHRFIGETQLAGRKFDSLDREITLPTGDITSLVDLVPAANMHVVEYSDPRTMELFAKLDPMERTIVETYFSAKMTWSEAAVECGVSPSRGEAVRRKIKEIGNRHQEKKAS